MWSNSGYRGDNAGWYHNAGNTDASQTTAFLARADAITTVGSTERAAYKKLINGMVSDGDFALMDALYIYATDTQAHALLDLTANALNGTTHGTVSFSADHGFTGNSSDFYIDTGYSPSGTKNYTSSSSSLGVYSLRSRTTGQNWINIGSQNNGSTIYHALYPKFTDNNAYVQYTGNAGAAMANAQGLSIGVRTSSTAMALWKNGSSVTTSSSATAALPGNSFYIFCTNNGLNVGAQYTSDQLSAAFMGGGGINVANVSSRINQYMTDLGINVY